MSKSELEQMIVAETKSLSIEILSEVLDFIQFLKVKRANQSTHRSFANDLTSDLTDLNSSELSHTDEEFSDYKRLYPRDH